MEASNAGANVLKIILAGAQPFKIVIYILIIQFFFQNV